MKSWSWIVLVVAVPMALTAAEAGDWLPPQVEAGLEEQLAARLAAEGEAAAPAAVAGVKTTLEAWGEDGTLERAPRHDELGVPGSENPWLDGIARLHTCNVVLYLRLEDPAFADAEPSRRTSALGLTAVTMAILRLRRPFVAAGHSDAETEALLTGAQMDGVLRALQEERASYTAAWTRCRPLVDALLD